MLQELLPAAHCWKYQSLTGQPHVPAALLFTSCEHFMARHIFCFHITDEFVLSLNHWPLLDNLNDVVQLQELSPSQSNLCRLSQNVHKHCRRDTHMLTPPHALTW